MTSIPFGAQSMTAPLNQVLVKAPGMAFGGGFNKPEFGFRHPVNLTTARREHAGFVALLRKLGVTVHELVMENNSPDFIYQYDPALVTDRGAILLRSGKPNRRGEEDLQRKWFEKSGIPVIGRIEAPGTVDGGDVFWLRPDVVWVDGDPAVRRVAERATPERSSGALPWLLGVEDQRPPWRSRQCRTGGA